MSETSLPASVVCLHGFLRTGASMMPMAFALRRGGYARFYAPTYRYEVRDLAAIAEQCAGRLRAIAERDGGPVDLVTHSYGGLLARAVLPQAPVRRVVMLAPPNQGAQTAQLVRERLPVHQLGWDPLQHVLPGAPSDLPAGPAEIGILTGGVGHERGYNPILDGDNDFTVRVEEAALDGAADFKVVRAQHTVIMMHREVQELTLRFLRTGRFEG